MTFSDVTGKAGMTGAPENKEVNNEVTNVDEDKRIGKHKKTTGTTGKKPGEV